MPLKRMGIVSAILAVLATAPVMLFTGQADDVSSTGTLDQVTLVDHGQSYTFSNRYCTAVISKRSGDLTSLTYKGKELMGYDSGHHAGYWEQSPASPVASITIDPGTNHGERAEVSIKGTATGGVGGGTNNVQMEVRYAMGQNDSGVYTYAIFSHDAKTGPGSVGESRYGVKLPNMFDWLSIDAQRNRLMPTAADWAAGTQLNMKEVRRLNTGTYKGEAEHKYDYSAYQFRIPAFGWSSTTQHIGLYFINPSTEFLSGGATKYELTGHLDANPGGAPTLLDYWRGTHYGGSICRIPAGEAWSKVVGPIMIYLNSKDTPQEMYDDALAKAKQESQAWPYDWVQGVDYPHRDQRGTLSGQIVLNDPQATTTKLPNLLVGLAFPDQKPPAPSNGASASAGSSLGSGATDSASSSGVSSSSASSSGATRNGATSDKTAPDTSTANSSASGGATPGSSASNSANPNGANPGNDRGGSGGTDQSKADSAGSTRGLGPGGFGGYGGFGFGGRGFGRGPSVTDWQNDAKHYEFWVQGDEDGHFVIPNIRPGTYQLHAIADGVLGEFSQASIEVKAGDKIDLGKLQWTPVRYGKQLWEIGIPNRTGAEFFKGDDYFHWGWYVQYAKLFPNDVHYDVDTSDFHKDWFFEQVPHDASDTDADATGRGRATPWTITFNLPQDMHGKATLRLAICGAGTRTIDVTVNGKAAGTVNMPFYNATINRDGIGGYWSERNLSFDAALMHAGKNTMVLTVPAGGLTSGIIYDYLRLELAEDTAVAE
ncbi:MAG TPA: polysaccharide lyase family protein [Pirellulales bacterium]|nr:polysaccharide lyase family protein [Pirellulales bacterium]